MEDSKLKKLTIERFSFESAFSHAPNPLYACTQFAYLDRHTGEVIWVYENDEDAEMEVGIAAEAMGQAFPKKARSATVASIFGVTGGSLG